MQASAPKLSVVGFPELSVVELAVSVRPSAPKLSVVELAVSVQASAPKVTVLELS